MALGSQVGSVFVKLGADTAGFDRGMGQAQKSMGSLGQTAAGVGKTVAIGMAVMGAAVVGIGIAAVKAASDFEASMSGIKAVSGASTAEMKGLHDLTLQLGKDTVFSAGESAKGIEELLKGGVSIADVMGGAAKATLNLASAGGVDLATAAEIAANALAMFNLTGSDMAHVSDLIAGAANASSLSVTDFKFSLAASGAVAKLAGQSFDDLAVAIAIMGKAGIKGQDAGTSLKTMLMRLSPSTKAQTKEFQKLGIITKKGTNLFIDAKGKYKSLAEISEILRDKTKGLTQAQKLASLEIMFGSDAIRAAGILSEGGAESFDKMATAMGKVTAEGVATTRLDNLKGSIEQLKGSLETAGIVLGEKFLPKLRPGIEWATDLVNKVTDALQTGNWEPVKKAIETGLNSVWDTVKTLPKSIWDILTLRTEQVDSSGTMRTYRLNIVTELEKWLGSIWSSVKPAAVNVGEFLFGKESWSPDDPANKSWQPGWIQQTITAIDTAMGTLAEQIKSDTTLKAKSGELGASFGNLIRTGLESLGSQANGGGKSGADSLGEEVGNTFVGPFFDGMIRGIINAPPDADLGKAVGEKIKESIAYGLLSMSEADKEVGAWGIMTLLEEKIAGMLVGPEALARLKGKIQSGMGWAGAQIPPAVATGIDDNTIDVQTSINEMMTKAKESGRISALPAGTTVGQAFDAGEAAGIYSYQQSVADAAKRVSANASAGAKGPAYSGALGVGASMAQGMADGMWRNQYLVLKAAGGIAAAGERRARAMLESNSPSKVFASIGKDMMGGWQQGIEQGSSRVLDAVGAVAGMSPSMALPAFAGGMGGGGGGSRGAPVTIVLQGNTFLGDDRSTAKRIAELLQPELDALVRWN